MVDSVGSSDDIELFRPDPAEVDIGDDELDLDWDVNGQFDVPAGGQVKVPTLCGMF